MLDPQELAYHLRMRLPERLQGHAYSLANMLAELIGRRISPDEARQRLLADAALREVLTLLAGQQVELRSAVGEGTPRMVSFGDQSQVGDVVIRDVVGRDIVNLNISVQLGQLPPTLDANTRVELERAYRQELVQLYGYWHEHYAALPLTVVSPVRGPGGGQEAPLANLFDHYHMRQAPGPDPSRRPKYQEQLAHSLGQALQLAGGRLVLLGVPGGGKTVAVERFALELAEAGLTSNPLTPLPIIVRLGRVSPGTGLMELMAQELTEAGTRNVLGPEGTTLRAHHGLTGILAALLAEGRAVLLWDGLNEAPSDSFEATARQLEKFHLEYAGSWPQPYVQSVITCRRDVFEYWQREYRGKQRPLDPQRIAVASIAPLDEASQRMLILRRLGEKHGAELLAALEHPAQRTLKQLARTPLLLKMICEVYRATEALPANRGELIHSFVRQLGGVVNDRIEWERERHWDWEQDRERTEWIGQEAQKRALQLLAYAIIDERKGTTVPWQWAARQMKAATTVSPPEQLRTLAQEADLLDVIDTKRAQDVRFSHQLFQEYFAACELEPRIARAMQLCQSPVLAVAGQLQLRRYVQPGKRTGWEETILLLAGLEGKNGYARTLIRTFLSRPLAAARLLINSNDRVDTSLVEEVCLALLQADAQQTYAQQERAEIYYSLGQLATHDQVSPELFNHVRGALWRVVFDPTRSNLERLEAGRSLGKLGDPRPGVASVEPDWCTVPGGAFWLGSRPDDTAAPDWEKPCKQVYLPEFRIARYPVTNRQWEQFLADGGPDAYGGWWRHIERMRWDLREARGGSPTGDPTLHGPNQPVVGVTWYKAQAFCGWLSARLGYSVYLPSEAQWEKAARGPDGRLFPWGQAWDKSRANSEEGPVYAPTPVGCYPDGVSPAGALDMSGNVWEWTDSPWLDDYHGHDGTQRYQANEDRPVVIRGGCWYETLKMARCASRFFRGPSAADEGVGFRVACDPA